MQYWQVGKESVAGTAVAATRKLYLKGNATRERDANLIKLSTGTRDNQRDIKLRTVKAGGKFQQPLSADEIVELLLSSIGTTTATQNGTTGQYDWKFAPGATLDPQTYEWFDGYRGWQLRGALIDELKIAGTISGDTTVDATLFGRELAQNAMTGSLTDRKPSFIQGWEAKLYLDALGATPGTTNVPATLIAWSVDIKNGAMRKNFGDNTTATGNVVLNDLTVQAELTLEANAGTFAEYGNWDAATPRLLRLELGNNGSVIGTSTVKPKVCIDLPGAWDAADLSGEDNGTRVYKLKLDYLYDQTNGYGLQVTASNGRATAY